MHCDRSFAAPNVSSHPFSASSQYGGCDYYEDEAYDFDTSITTPSPSPNPEEVDETIVDFEIVDPEDVDVAKKLNDADADDWEKAGLEKPEEPVEEEQGPPGGDI